MLKACVVQFTKTPQLGKVKTRMQPYLTQQQSCQLHDALTRQVMCNLLSKRWDYRVFWAGLDDGVWRDDVLSQMEYLSSQKSITSAKWFQQQGADLGERMAHAFSVTLEDYQVVVLVGSDCPGLTEQWVEQAIKALEEGGDVCFTPAEDGGYVLVAMRKARVSLFSGVDWGTEQVLSQSLSIAQGLGLQVRLLPSLADIDRPEDLALLSGFEWAAPLLEAPSIP